MTDALAGFFSGGGKTAKFPTIGTSVSGTIRAVHPPEPQTEMLTGKEIPDKFQVRIDLDTDDRDPTDPEDTGARTLYVKGWMRGAIADAVRHAGAQGPPDPGGRLTVTFSSEKPSTTVGLSPTKIYDAVYVPPTAASTAGFFGSGSPAAADPWRKADGTPAASNGGGPVKPDSIDGKAWDAMDASTKAAVAATMSQLSDQPPF